MTIAHVGKYKYWVNLPCYFHPKNVGTAVNYSSMAPEV